MKKFLLAIAGLTALSAQAIDWEQEQNVVPQGATVTVSSENNGNDIASKITDGDNSTRWQASPATHAYTQDWALIDLGEPKTFTDIEIIWESSHAAVYRIFTSNEAPRYEEKQTDDGRPYNALTEGWEDSMTLFGSGGKAADGNYTETIIVGKPVTAQYILVYCDEYSNNGNTYGASIFEVRAAEIEGRSLATSLTISSYDIPQGMATEFDVNAWNEAGGNVGMDAVHGLQFVCDDPEAVTIREGDATGQYFVTGNKLGSYTITATALNDNDETISDSASFYVTYPWEYEAKNIAKGKAISARWRVENDAEDNSNPYYYATDGEEQTYYCYNGGWGGGNSWVIVDLGDDYVVSAVSTVSGDKSRGIYRVAYASETASLPEEDLDKVWAALNLTGWTTTEQIDRRSNAQNDYVFATPVVAKYIAIYDVDNPEGKPQYCEIRVAGEKLQNPELSAISINITQDLPLKGETIDLNIMTLNQFGSLYQTDILPEVNILEGEAEYANGKLTLNTLGTIKVQAQITTEGQEALKTDVLEITTVADVDDYVMTNAVITSDNDNANAIAATDGGAQPNSHGNADYVIAPAETPGAHEHWLLAELDKAYDLDMIIAIWEGACPSNYDVWVGNTEETLTKVYTVIGHTQQYWYDRLVGQEMKNVRFIKIETHENATQHGIKLFDLKAYGKAVPVAPKAPEFNQEENSGNSKIVLRTDVGHELYYKVYIQNGANTVSKYDIQLYAIDENYTNAEEDSEDSPVTVTKNDNQKVYTFDTSKLIKKADSSKNSIEDLGDNDTLVLSAYAYDPETDLYSDEGKVGVVKSGTTTGIENVIVGNDNETVEYYNLQGVRVVNPDAGQIVIRRQGNQVTKELVK